MSVPSIRLAVCSLVLAACASGDGTDHGRATAPLEPAVRDSAGVTIYEHPADALERAPLWVVESAPMVVIGGEDESDDVTRVRQVLLLGDGRIAAFDGALGGITIHGPDGTRQRTIGRRGAGPGEFGRSVVTMARIPGDTIVASDNRNSRLTVIDPDTAVVRMTPASFRLDFTNQPVAGRFDNGDWILSYEDQTIASSMHQELTGPRESRAIGVLRQHSDSLSIDTLVVIPGTELAHFRYMFGDRESDATGTPVYGARSYATAWGGLAAVVTNERWEVRRYGPDGRLASLVVMAGPPRPVTAEMVVRRAEVLRRMTREYAVENDRDVDQALEQTEFTLDHTPVASTMPAFSAMHPTPGRLLWLADVPESPDDSLRFTAIDQEGRLVARLALAPATRVSAFGDDRVVIRTTEPETGIVRFEVYRVAAP
jgi:hypothetical protein